MCALPTPPAFLPIRCPIHEGICSSDTCRVPSLTSVVGLWRIHGAVWAFFLYYADLAMKIEIWRYSEIATWGERGSIAIATLWIAGYAAMWMLVLFRLAPFAAEMVGRRNRK